MIRKLLVANRGEIALRIVRVARRMGIGTVAVYSDIDANSLHVKLADEAYSLGNPRAEQSYLNIDKIIAIARDSGAEAIHPGYGFLAENADFVRACEQENIIFVGPSSETTAKLGDKVQARKLAQSIGVPVIPGAGKPSPEVSSAMETASEVGYPVLIKAVNGGGGKAMRPVRNPDEMADAFNIASKESQAAFGTGDVYVEKLLESPRHIEVQIMADSRGEIIHLFERECSIQRRHQKVIEECPCPILDEDARNRITNYARDLASASGYTNAGTFEFLRDKDGIFYFLEANCRLQVEHPITEMATGTNLIEWQLLIASNETHPCRQEEIALNGHAIEVRVYAEDPFGGFLASPGKILSYIPAMGHDVRVDSALFRGAIVPSCYDPLIAKITTWGRDRKSAIEKMQQALDECVITGVSTTMPYCKQLLSHERFLAGDIDTRFVEEVSFETGSTDGVLVPFIAAALERYLGNSASGKSAEKPPVRYDPGRNWRMSGRINLLRGGM
jgi:acetyl-CoA carboxylase biotin carboxylase subunit